MINALLEAPEGFKPEAYGVSKEMLGSWTKVWQFCLDHQLKEKEPPARGLVARSFPDFELLSGVKPTWAADKLRSAYRERTMRKEVKTALDLLNLGSVDQAQDIMRKIAKPMHSDALKGLNVLDPKTVEDDKHKVAYPTLWEYLNRLTDGGVGLGELWFVAMRFGQGKSWYLPAIGYAMAEMGARVAAVTIEMPKKSYVRRAHRIMSRGDKTLISRLFSPDKETRLKGLADVPKMLGIFDVFDPSDMTMDTKAIRRLAQEYQYVCIDHMGLMLNEDGVPAIKDWRIAAEISNEMKRITLEERVGIVGAVQVNREGESNGFLPPKAHNLAGADDLGRDADVLIMGRRMGERSMLLDIPKNRDKISGRFYTAFEPGIGNFAEISKDQALDRARQDEEAKADN